MRPVAFRIAANNSPHYHSGTVLFIEKNGIGDEHILPPPNFLSILPSLLISLDQEGRHSLEQIADSECWYEGGTAECMQH
jgi:hypothetical protein